MTKEEAKEKIEYMLRSLATVFGQADGIVVIEASYPTGTRGKPNKYTAEAARLRGNKLQFGVVVWDFGDDDSGDLSTYDWSFTADDFCPNNDYDLNDTVEAGWAFIDLMVNTKAAEIESL